MGENCLDMGIEQRDFGFEEEDAKPAAVAINGTRKVLRYYRRGSLDEEDFMNLLHGSDPVKIELNRLENEVREKNRELAESQNEIKALRLTERAKEKALAEVSEELQKTILKYRASEALIEDKNLEIKRISEEKKDAVAAQLAAEATLRRVYAAQKDEELLPIEAILSPLEAEVKILRLEISKLQEDNRALERLTKSKEMALLEAEKEVNSAKIKAALVDELLNRNQDLVKQNDICQEEYKILDRMHRQKVAEVEKMAHTIREMEEALLSGAAVANAVRDYQRQVNELKGEKKTLERTLSRVKVTENRAAAVIVNEWKDTNEKSIPLKQWLEERRVLMGEMQQLRDKLSVAERTAKAEAQLKEKFQIRLKIVEDSLRSSIARSNCHAASNCNASDSNNGYSSPSTNGSSLKKAPPPLGRSSSMSRYAATTIRLVKGASRSFDGGKSFEHEERNGSIHDDFCCETKMDSSNSLCKEKEQANGRSYHLPEGLEDDLVAGVLYDLLQKEVIALRRSSQEKDQALKDRESSIEILSRKIDTLTKALEVEVKKTQREKLVMAKEIASIRAEREQEQKLRRLKGIPNNANK